MSGPEPCTRFWRTGRPLYVEHPLFLTSAPGDLCRLWAACQSAPDSGKEVSNAPSN